MQILLLILLDLIIRQKYESPQKNDLQYFSSDLNEIPSNVRFFKYYTNTPNAPGVNVGLGIMLYYDNNFSVQIAVDYGGDLKYRTSMDGIYSEWKTFNQ